MVVSAYTLGINIFLYFFELLLGENFEFLPRIFYLYNLYPLYLLGQLKNCYSPIDVATVALDTSVP